MQDVKKSFWPYLKDVSGSHLLLSTSTAMTLDWASIALRLHHSTIRLCVLLVSALVLWEAILKVVPSVSWLKCKSDCGLPLFRLCKSFPLVSLQWAPCLNSPLPSPAHSVLQRCPPCSSSSVTHTVPFPALYGGHSLHEDSSVLGSVVWTPSPPSSPTFS